MEAAKRCQAEFDSLKQNIIAHKEVQHIELLQEMWEQIAAHNSRRANIISVEIIEQQQQAEAKTRTDQENVTREQVLRGKRTAQLEKEKADALAAYTHQISDAPYVPPVAGWAHEAELGTAHWYVILPGTGLTSNCRFTMNRSYPALDCIGGENRNDYVSVVNNGHWYLLKAKRINGAAEVYATTVKDGGLTICFQQAGCYHILAEIRQEPTELPDKLEGPPPASRK